MNCKTAEITEPSFNLPSLLERVAAGDEITITRNGVALARLVSIVSPKKRRVPGSAKGLFTVPDNFNDPLPPDIQRYFDGEDEDPLK